MNQIEIYKAKDGQTHIEVKFEADTVWLNQKQIAALFCTQRPAITKHLNNIFTSGELVEGMVSSILEHTTQHGAIKGKTQETKVKYYNLDAIISVGYRVNSAQATQFRQWATQRLKDYLVQGYSINQKRLEQLQHVVNIIHQSGSTKNLSEVETKGLLDIITNYTQSFILLNQFDSNSLSEENLDENINSHFQNNLLQYLLLTQFAI